MHDFGDVSRDLSASFPRGVKLGRCHGMLYKLQQLEKEKVSQSCLGVAEILHGAAR
jgi:hypothetical protein